MWDPYFVNRNSSKGWESVGRFCSIMPCSMRINLRNECDGVTWVGYTL